MTTLKFQCCLLSDVILNQKAATEGSQTTLEFIPGNVFLGIVASRYNQFSTTEQAAIFHSGKVRFGDAHPCNMTDSTRSLLIPAAFYYPKLSSISREAYLHHFHDRSKENLEAPLQLKQCRNGFYTFSGKDIFPQKVNKNFALKSAYNRDSRRADDSKMYGYESIGEGTEFLFTVECDDECNEVAQKIAKALTGVKHIGRSRTAQYGIAEITQCSFAEQESSRSTFDIDGQQCITVYADGRLIFLDEHGEPTFTPTAQDFGLNGRILWDKSQTRTFQYAPWNGKRQTRDTDRAGFEKGSTFVISLNGDLPANLPTYVGSYRNEGFGKVIYGWQLLQEANANGRVYLQEMVYGMDINKPSPAELSGTPLLSYLARQRRESDAVSFIYEKVNDFASKFKANISPSQWGAIRDIAAKHPSAKDIMWELFDKTTIINKKPTKENSCTETIELSAYLTHGVAAEKWKGRPLEMLKEFTEKMGTIYGDIAQQALINLASEMAKKSNKE